MGNEGSNLNGLKIEEKATVTTDFWSHHRATIDDSCLYFSLKSDGSVSVFKGEAVLGPLWSVSTPLEKFSNNLLKFRHPYIIRYISAWQQRSTFHLATEYVLPISQVLSTQTPLQICVGLNNILEALVFLHQVGISHNNVSTSAIYITGDGQWKLGGLQYLCPFTELTPVYLKQAKIHRYDKAIDPNEDSNQITTKVDQYAFAVLVNEVFSGHKDDDVPYLREFRNYCRDFLQNDDPLKRPDLSEVLNHNFFNHEFISIHKFLTFLPLKSEQERSQFFSDILNNLKCYEEETVAKQFGGLLLSRLTLLDQTARKELIPYILRPKNERMSNGENIGLFNLEIFKEYVKPRLLQLFGVRDTQIRMLLLTHFTKFVHVFTHEELSQHILPELLVGIKDIDDSLVTSTLICLSELVPILGADTVVGGKRSKLFTDGRPKVKSVHILHPSVSRIENSDTASKNYLGSFTPTVTIYQHSSNETSFEKSELNERPTPVGGESIDDKDNITETINKMIESEEDWSDWENNSHLVVSNENMNDDNLIQLISNEKEIVNHVAKNETTENTVDEISHCSKETRDKQMNRTSMLHRAGLEAKRNILDISLLDIKNQKINVCKQSSDEFDFFADMTPVIEKPTVINVVQNDRDSNLSSKLNFVLNENESWGDNWNE